MRGADFIYLLQSHAPLRTSFGIQAILPYQHINTKILIEETKFRKNIHAARICADFLETTVREHITYMQLPPNTHICIIPIPITLHRKRTYGYDHIQFICSQSVFLSLHTIPLLAINPHHNMREQKKLGRSQRYKESEQKFIYNKKYVSCDAKQNTETLYIIIDDVVTTGATLESARNVLFAHGAKNISCIAVAH